MVQIMVMGIYGIYLVANVDDNKIGGIDKGNVFGFNAVNLLSANNNGTKIRGNFFNTNIDGEVLGDGMPIQITGATEQVIGGDDPGQGNTAGFGTHCISITSSEGVFVRGNFIGTDASGRDLGASSGAIRVSESDNIYIGGPSSAYGNTIGFSGSGITLGGTSGTIVRNNFIGTDASGRDLGNGGSGIVIFDGGENTIGGINTYGNTIGFNVYGINIYRSSDNKIRGNYIGTNREGDNIGNQGTGILIELADTQGNKIGYNPAAAIPLDSPKGNTIAYNGGYGVFIEQEAVASDSPNQTPIRGNKIYENAGLGIDLDPAGGTLNDVDDGDEGANNLQNYPDVIQW